jgi:hypothetical protein
MTFDACITDSSSRPPANASKFPVNQRFPPQAYVRRYPIVDKYSVAWISREALRAVGRQPLIQGFLLWAIMGSATLGTILLGWIG